MKTLMTKDKINFPVLIVDDDLVDRMSLERWCSKKQIPFKIARNGMEAIKLINSEEFSLVFSDIDMPFASGLDLVIAVRKTELNTHKHLPIIAVTGNEALGFKDTFRQFGFDNFIPKPPNPDQLENAFTMALKNR